MRNPLQVFGSTLPKGECRWTPTLHISSVRWPPKAVDYGVKPRLMSFSTIPRSVKSADEARIGASHGRRRPWEHHVGRTSLSVRKRTPPRYCVPSDVVDSDALLDPAASVLCGTWAVRACSLLLLRIRGCAEGPSPRPPLRAGRAVVNASYPESTQMYMQQNINATRSGRNNTSCSCSAAPRRCS